MKKIIFAILLLILPGIVFGATLTYEAAIDTKLYTTLEKAVADAEDGDTIKVLSNVVLENTLIINKDITIDLNSYNIEAKEQVIKVQDANLILTGKGTIKETLPNYYTILIKGSKNEEDINYSTVVIGEEVVLEGWRTIFIDQLGDPSLVDTTEKYPTAYGVNVEIYGTLISKKNMYNDSGACIYIHNNIKHTTNYPEIYIHDNAILKSDGQGIYMAGYSKIVIDKANITGIDSGIAIKSGILNINYSSINCTGEKKDPVGDDNEINPTGAALQIESNNKFAGKMVINISNGNLYSENAQSIIEYIGNQTTQDTSIKEISINGEEGKFISPVGLDTLKFSSKVTGRFITGGSFTSDPNKYVNRWYKTVHKDNMYKVVFWTEQTMAKANYGSTNILPYIFIITGGILLFFIAKKVIKIIKNKKIRIK